MYVSLTRKPQENVRRTFVNESPKSFVEKLRKRSGKNVWLMARELARDFLKKIWRRTIYRHRSVLIGEGIPLSPAAPATRITLLENKTLLESLSPQYAAPAKKPKRKK